MFAASHLLGISPADVAEDGAGFVALSPGEVRDVLSDVTLTNGPIPLPEHGSACRVRFETDVDERIAAVRAWFAARRRDRFTWMVGPNSTPRDLEQRLLAVGAEPSPLGPDLMAMVLDHEPPPGPADVEVRRVETFADYVSMWEIIFEGFARPSEERDAVRATLADRWRVATAETGRWSYLAFVDGNPVAEGAVRRTVVGPLWLAGGVTLEPFRGRGIYRSLVRARWDDAVRLGIDALVVSAKVETSYPILDRLGFRSVGRVTWLVDRSSTVSSEGL